MAGEKKKGKKVTGQMADKKGAIGARNPSTVTTEEPGAKKEGNKLCWNLPEKEQSGDQCPTPIDRGEKGRSTKQNNRKMKARVRRQEQRETRNSAGYKKKRES